MTVCESPTRPRRAVLRDSLGVGIAVGVSGVAFGGTAVAGGLSVAQAGVLSLLAFTGASQFALVAAVAAGGNPLPGAVGALLLGSRNALYGLRVGPLLGLTRTRQRLAAAQFVIDETTAVTLAQPDRRSARLGFSATAATLFVLWNATTLAGAVGATALGDPSRYGLDVAGPACFLALLVPQLRGARERYWVAGVAVVLALATSPYLPSGVPILLATPAVPLVLLAGRRPDRGAPVAAQGSGEEVR
ncbi:AzlC family ABC transporter permease [Actinocatenispora sera]|uniref:Branched-chain amino acid ABC transporter permease n=1 Tax=Actinocatenispora sera TaxID=390989 RepID=A0A810L298_9ACTN|nr:AzlC family ABC transporter permease [Actinocatenispora sera]BCJ29337.1 branched-chain amino acid ABC transporter permease [Actinocatenispora sera]